MLNVRFLLILGKAPPEATFKGKDFLSYDLIRLGGEPIVSIKDEIHLGFKVWTLTQDFTTEVIFFGGRRRSNPLHNQLLYVSPIARRAL